MQPGRARYTLVMVVLSLLGVVLAGITYTEVRLRQAEYAIESEERARDRQWCELLRFLTEPPAPGVKLDDRQKQVLKLMNDLKSDRGC